MSNLRCCRCRESKQVPLRGPPGLPGPPSSNDSAQLVNFDMSAQVLGSFNPGPFLFAIQNSAMFGNLTIFNPSTTNPFPVDNAQTFLVPSNGTLSNLLGRVTARVPPDTQPITISPTFQFTVYQSPNVINSASPTIGWTATSLSTTTPSGSISNGESVTFVTPINALLLNVRRGDIICVVITCSGYAAFEVQPATIQCSLRFRST